MRGMVENYCPRGAIFTEARNSRLRLNFTEGAIIFYHSPIKKAVNICFIHTIHRFCGLYRTVEVKNSADVTASPRVREM